MAEQVYIYGATQNVRPASYSYGGYATSESAQVGAQPVYSVNVQQQPGQSYSYEPSGYATASGLTAAPSAGYAQSDLSQQPQYALQVVAATQSSAYAASQAGSYTAVPGSSLYGTTQAVVTPGGAYAAPSAYGQQQQQQATAYVQQHPQAHLQLQVQSPSAQPTSAYGMAAAAGHQTYGGQAQVIAAGQPAAAAYTQQPPPQHGQPTAGQQTVIYGQPPPTAQPGVPSYGQPQQAQAMGYAAPPVAQAAAATAYAQPAPGQAQVYAAGQPQVQQAMISQMPPQQQTAVYMLPAAASAGAPQPAQYTIPPPTQQPPPVAAYRPAVSGRPASPVDLVPYDQRPLNLPPAGGRGPPGALLGPSVVLNAVLGGPRGSPSFSRGRDGPGRGYGGRDRGDNDANIKLDDTVFIQGLPETVNEELLAKQFSAVGTVKLDARGKPRVWVCRDQQTGRPRGDGIVGYETPQAASMAIDRFHRTEFLGAVINVRHATKKPSSQQSRPRGKNDWICVVGNCGNHNFAWRTECNRCKAPRPAPADKDGGGDSGVGSVDGDMNGRSSPRPGMQRSDGRAGPGGRGRGDRNFGGPMMRGRFERRNQPY